MPVPKSMLSGGLASMSSMGAMPPTEDIKKSKYKTASLKDYVDRTQSLYDGMFGSFFPQEKMSELEKRNQDFRGKYGEFAANREYWGDLYNKEIPSEKRKLGEVINDVAAKTGINPDLLLGSALEEGFFKSVHGDRVLNYSGTPDEKYKFNGMSLLGLDTFYERKDGLKKYLPEGFDFIESKGANNKGEMKSSALFKSPSDALTAMTAFLRSNKDELDGLSKKKGLNLSPAAKDFFTMAAYNGGIGNVEKMIDYYQLKGLLKDDKFLKTDDLALDKYGGIYQNVRRRIDPVQALRKEGKLQLVSPSASPQSWTAGLVGTSAKEGQYQVVTPRKSDIPFKIVVTGSGRKIAPRNADLAKLDVNKLPDLDADNYEANVKKLK